jgi:putative SOS response-associated peptidase YedK
MLPNVQSKDYGRWLGPENEGTAEILGPYSGEMTTYPVRRRLNNPNNEGTGLIRRVGD